MSSAVPMPSNTELPRISTPRFGDTALSSAPMPYSTRPPVKHRLRPQRSVSLEHGIIRIAMISRNNVIAVCTPLTVVSRSSLMSLIITFMFEPAKLQMNCARASGRISRRADRAGLGANARSTDTDASVTGLSATGARADATQTRLAQPLQPGFGDRVTGRARGGVSGDRRQEVRALQRVQARV